MTPSSPSGSEKEVLIYTDGACRGNPGPGGWAALLIYEHKEKMISGFEGHTTNNRMEMLAAVEGLRALTKPSSVQLFTDSRYLKDGITLWLPKWLANNWKTVNKAPVKNQDLWCDLSDLSGQHQVRWCWVKAHAGHPYNERVDAQARQEIVLHTVKNTICNQKRGVEL